MRACDRMHVHENINCFTYLRSGLVGISGSISVLCHHQLLCRSHHFVQGVHPDLISWMFYLIFLFYYLISSGCQMEDLSILPFWLKIYILSSKAPIPPTLVFPGWVHRPFFWLRILFATTSRNSSASAQSPIH